MSLRNNFPMLPKFPKFSNLSNLSNLPFALPTIFTGTIFRTREAIGEKFYF